MDVYRAGYEAGYRAAGGEGEVPAYPESEEFHFPVTSLDPGMPTIEARLSDNDTILRCRCEKYEARAWKLDNVATLFVTENGVTIYDLMVRHARDPDEHLDELVNVIASIIWSRIRSDRLRAVAADGKA